MLDFFFFSSGQVVFRPLHGVDKVNKYLFLWLHLVDPMRHFPKLLILED